MYETMQLSEIAGYQTGGTINVICNNQVGFTAHPEQGRSTMYASDLGKTFGVPIFHVNADDPEAVQRVFELSTQWRQQFRTDVVIDLVGYRKNGHNEIDEPTFTHPTMYQAIKRHKTPLAVYRGAAARGGQRARRTRSTACSTRSSRRSRTRSSRPRRGPRRPRTTGSTSTGSTSARPTRARAASRRRASRSTSCAASAPSLDHTPEGFAVHKRLDRQLKAKSSMFVEGNENTTADGAGVDWATAEALAFGGCLLEDHAVRFTGQDAERGTFSHAATRSRPTRRRARSTSSSTTSRPRPARRSPPRSSSRTRRSPSASRAARCCARARARPARARALTNGSGPPLTPRAARRYAVLGYELGYRWRRPTCSSCGRRSSATSSTARRSSSTSSSRRARPSGCASRAS